MRDKSKTTFNLQVGQFVCIWGGRQGDKMIPGIFNDFNLSIHAKYRRHDTFQREFSNLKLDLLEKISQISTAAFVEDNYCKHTRLGAKGVF